VQFLEVAEAQAELRHDGGRDVQRLLAKAQLPYAESLAMACFAELPLAALLAWTAWRALDWAAPLGAPRPQTPA
jgi:hypothetical protein